MARGIIHLDGLDDVIADFDRVVGDIEIESTRALNDSLSTISNQMKINLLSVIKGDSTGTLYRSIGHHVGKPKEGLISASVGVYETKGVVYPKTANQGRTYSAPMVAYFIEFGTQASSTSSGARAANSGRKSKKQGNSMSKGTPPKPFLSNAFDNGAEGIMSTIEEYLNKSIDKK